MSASITSVIFTISPLPHQQLDDIDATLRHAVGEFLNGDRLRQDHFAGDLFLLLGDMALEPLDTPAE